MWHPRSADELVKAIEAGALPHEAAGFDVKAQLPVPKASGDIAVDVAAMATDGGVIIYGISEDKAVMTFGISPVDLAGVRERISDVVAAHVRERIEFSVHLLPLADDPAKGFVVVDIPASLRAPHMVETKNEYRYYGRVAGGNAMLTEAQVALLYDRRQKLEAESHQALDAAIAAALPLLAPRPGFRGHLHLVAHPLLSDRWLRRRAWPGDDGLELGAAVINAQAAIHFRTPRQPEIVDVMDHAHNQPTFDGFAIVNPPAPGTSPVSADRRVSRIEVLDDGTTRYFHSAVAIKREDPALYEIMDSAIAQITAHFVELAGCLLDAGKYHGPVDVFAAVIGAGGACSADWSGRGPAAPFEVSVVPGDDYRSQVRMPSTRLVAEPCEVAMALLARLLRAIRPKHFPDPWQC
jgi:hypothetical protein